MKNILGVYIGDSSLDYRFLIFLVGIVIVGYNMVIVKLYSLFFLIHGFGYNGEMGGIWLDSEDGRKKKQGFFQIPHCYTLHFILY